jgi:hypothetical protein
MKWRNWLMNEPMNEPVDEAKPSPTEGSDDKSPVATLGAPPPSSKFVELLALSPLLTFVGYMLLLLLFYRIFFDGWAPLQSDNKLITLIVVKTRVKSVGQRLNAGIEKADLHALSLERFTLREEQAQLNKTSAPHQVRGTIRFGHPSVPQSKPLQSKPPRNSRPYADTSKRRPPGATPRRTPGQTSKRTTKRNANTRVGNSRLASESANSIPDWKRRAITAMSSRYAGRVNWAAFAVLQAVICCCASLSGLYAINKALRDESRAEQVVAYGLALLLASFLSVAMLRLPYMNDLASVLEQTVGKAGDFKDSANVVRVAKIFDAFSIFTAMLLTFTASMIVWPAVKNDPVVCGARPLDPTLPMTGEMTYVDRKALCIAIQLKQLLFVFTLGAAVLVASSLQIYAMLQWSLSCLQPLLDGGDSALYHSVERLALSFVTWRGLIYTLWLSAIYLPAAYILRSRAIALAVAADDGHSINSQHRWMEERGLSLSVTDMLPRLAALLAPLLTGPAAELIRSLQR